MTFPIICNLILTVFARNDEMELYFHGGRNCVILYEGEMLDDSNKAISNSVWATKFVYISKLFKH